MDIAHYYDRHWEDLPEGRVDYSRLQMIIDAVPPGVHALETGCGPGFLAAKLVEKGVDLQCTEVSHTGTERTRARGVRAQRVDLDTEPLPFPDGEFEYVIANSNLEHLFFIHRHVAECLRVLRPGGTFIWMVPNIGHWRHRWLLLRGRFPYLAESPTDLYHIRYMTMADARQTIEEGGGRVTAVRGHAGMWVRSLYPKPLRGLWRIPVAGEWFKSGYEALVRLRPSFFARYLYIEATKST